MVTCGQKGQDCYSAFNKTFLPAVQAVNMTALSLDEYTVCAEHLIPECGRFLGAAINTIRAMQQQYSTMCSGSGANPETVTDCVNGPWIATRSSTPRLFPAMAQYILTDMCSSIDRYSRCLNAVHGKQECQRYTTQALAGILTLKRQYSMYCGADAGQLTERCMTDFQTCYVAFNRTYFPSMHSANMDAMCSSVTQYTDCVQRLFPDCNQQLGQALKSVRAMKEQYSLQCDKQFQRLVKCQPLAVCSQNFARNFGMGGTTATFCTSLKSYFPCVETSMTQCNIASSDNKIDFASLGNLTGDYCQNFLNHPSVVRCADFKQCSAGVLMASAPQGTEMFDGATWCSSR
nr:hypothetical protein BaRGS_034534 [Batillaria attramentaria]